MSPELDKMLCERFPKIFVNRSAMEWGFECRDGWIDILTALCESIQQYVDHNEGAKQVVASQVKQKFGSLSFHLDEGDAPEVEGMIRMAGAMSRRICEECGKPGKLDVTTKWFKTRCAEHS